MAEDDLFKSLRDEFSSPKTHAAPGHIVDLREGSAPGWVMEEKEEPVPPAPPLPAPPMVFDPDAKAPDLLNKNLIRSLQRDAEILELPFDVDDPKTNNLIVTTSSSTKMAAIKVDENRLRAERQPEALERVLARIAQLIAAKETVTPMPDVSLSGSMPVMVEAAPMPLVTVIEEPPREPSFETFNRLKDAQDTQGLDEVLALRDADPQEVHEAVQDAPATQLSGGAPEPYEELPEATPGSPDPRAAAQRYRRTGIKPPVPAKDLTPAPGPAPDPSVTAAEQAFSFKFER